MNFFESISSAFNSIKNFKLRAALTLLSISIGVFAIMLSGTLVDSLNGVVDRELSELGDNSFYIKRFPSIMMGHTWRKYMKRKPITYSQVRDLKEDAQIPSLISAICNEGGQTVKSESLTSDPDVVLIGSDEAYFPMMNVGISDGRPFSYEDITLNRNVAVIGNDVVVKIFPNTNPLGKKIKIKNQSYEIIGLLETKGAVLGQSQDNRVVIPITHFLRYFANEWHESIDLVIRAPNKDSFIPAIDEVIGILRSLRNDKPGMENSFEVDTNESLSQDFGAFTGFIAIFGSVSGFIALIAAGVGIMNILLVSVKERTREIGVRKAVGARRSWILSQFMIESIVLCQVGGIIGIVMGIITGAVLSSMINIVVVFPIFWVLFSIFVCTVIGLIFGSYPAWKAAKLDPIDALRYE